MKRVKAGDTSERRAIRRKFKAKGFRWYLKNVFPASAMSIGAEIIGHLQRFGSKYCLDRLGRALNRQIGLYKCHGNGYNQGFSYQKNHQIVFHPDLCLGRAKKENVSEIPPELATDDQFLNDPNLLTPEMNTEDHIVLLPCNSTNGDKWAYNETVSIQEKNGLEFLPNLHHFKRRNKYIRNGFFFIRTDTPNWSR